MASEEEGCLPFLSFPPTPGIGSLRPTSLLGARAGRDSEGGTGLLTCAPVLKGPTKLAPTLVARRIPPGAPAHGGGGDRRATLACSLGPPAVAGSGPQTPESRRAQPGRNAARPTCRCGAASASHGPEVLSPSVAKWAFRAGGSFGPGTRTETPWPNVDSMPQGRYYNTDPGVRMALSGP